MAFLPAQANAARARLGKQLIDAVTANPFNSLPSNLVLGAFVIVDMVAKQVVNSPHDLAWFVAGPLNTVMQDGFQAITYQMAQTIETWDIITEEPPVPQ